ncbi:MAG: hypothetical protein ACOYXM_05405 [Actinomycetota bacterium]
MASPHPAYRLLVRLYPSSFRHEYGEDLVAHYADLVADRGARAAQARTALDLAITIPRYHLEHVMTEQQSTTVLAVILSLLAGGGVLSLLTGAYPGMLLFVGAAVVAIAQRSTLARALRVPSSQLRRRRLQTAAVLGAVFVALYVVYLATIGDTWTNRDTVLATVGTLAMFGSIGFLAAGLLTPRTPSTPDGRVASGNG